MKIVISTVMIKERKKSEIEDKIDEILYSVNHKEKNVYSDHKMKELREMNKREKELKYK
jgi:hypothetical protein